MSSNEKNNNFTNIKDNLPELTFVPTMGNLHQGHISLIDLAKQYENEIICLPNHRKISKKYIDYIVDAISNFY